MPLAVTVKKHWWDGKILHAIGDVTPSGSYSTGGDAFSFANLPEVKAQQVNPPLEVTVRGLAGYVYSYKEGNNRDDGALFVHESGADGSALDELGEADYPSAVTGDDIRYHALFKGIV